VSIHTNTAVVLQVSTGKIIASNLSKIWRINAFMVVICVHPTPSVWSLLGGGMRKEEIQLKDTKVQFFSKMNKFWRAAIEHEDYR
jgi:hypothetical protein